MFGNLPTCTSFCRSQTILENTRGTRWNEKLQCHEKLQCQGRYMRKHLPPAPMEDVEELRIENETIRSAAASAAVCGVRSVDSHHEILMILQFSSSANDQILNTFSKFLRWIRSKRIFISESWYVYISRFWFRFRTFRFQMIIWKFENCTIMRSNTPSIVLDFDTEFCPEL